MRNILFRGKRLDNGEWVYGYFVKYQPCASEDKFVCGIVPTYASALYLIEVDPETVGEYTGLEDKNGTKIFEGDIVYVTPSENQTEIYLSGYCQVCYEDKFACFVLVSNKDSHATAVTFSAFADSDIEVVGNIYGNPELLQKE